MGFTELLTIIFVLLKVFEVIDWSWWVVFLPEIIGVAFYLIVFVLGLLGVGSTHKRRNKYDRYF